MAIKIPIRTVYDNSDNAIGLSEFQSGDAVGSAHGGTGLTSLGSAGQVLQVNSGGNGFEFGDKTSVNLDPYLKVANANVNFVTKATALTTNNAIINLINDRLQVANANVTFVTKAVALSSNTTLKNLIDDRMQVANVSTLVTNEVNALIDSAPGALNTLNELAAALGDDANFSTTITNNLATKASNTYVNAQIGLSNTNIRAYVDAEIGSSNTNVRQYVDASVGASNTSIRTFANQTFETKAVALASNTAMKNLVDDRLQVANAAILYETKAVALAANNTQNNLINDRLQVANAAVAYVTKSTALTSNNNLLSLINDRIQVANVASSIRPGVSTVTANTSVDASDHNNAIIVNSSETIVISVAASSSLTTGDTFKFYPIGDGDIRIDLDSSDAFLGTNLSTTTISSYSDAAVSTLQSKTIQGSSFRDFVTTGLYTKVELLYAGSGNFVLTK